MYSHSWKRHNTHTNRWTKLLFSHLTDKQKHTLYLWSSSAAATAWWYRDRVETLGSEPLCCRCMYASLIHVHTHTHRHIHTFKTDSHTATHSVREHPGGSSGSPFRSSRRLQLLTELSLRSTTPPQHTYSLIHIHPPCVCQSGGGVSDRQPLSSHFTLFPQTNRDKRVKTLSAAFCTDRNWGDKSDNN